MKDNMLEVGDEIYSIGGFRQDTYRIHGKVDRVTKTMAFIGTSKFKRVTFGSGSIYPIPSQTGYHQTDYKIITDEVRKDMKKKAVRYKIESVVTNWAGNNTYDAVRKLSDNKLSRIADILGEE